MLGIPAPTSDLSIRGHPGVKLGHEFLKRALLLDRIGDLLLGPRLVVRGFWVEELGGPATFAPLLVPGRGRRLIRLVHRASIGWVLGALALHRLGRSFGVGPA